MPGPSPTDELAVTYLQLDERENAQAALREAIHLGRQDLATNGATLLRLFNLALYHVTAGDIEESRELWAQALALPGVTAYIRDVALGELRDLQAVLPDIVGLDEALRLLAERVTTD